MKLAKVTMYGLRQRTEVRDEANAVQDKHGSRKSGLPPSSKSRRKATVKDEAQGDLFA